MRTRYRILPLILLLGCGLLRGEESKPAAEKDVAALVKKLSSDAYQDRNAAQADLEKMGAAIVPALRKALADTKDLETQTRLQAILGRVSRVEVVIDAAGKATLNGQPYSADALKEARGRYEAENKAGARTKSGLSAMRVVLNVHDQTPYAVVQGIMVDCMKQQIWRISAVDAAPQEGEGEKEKEKGKASKKEEGLLDMSLPVDEGEGVALVDAVLEKPEEISIFIRDDAKARAAAPDKARGASFYCASRDATPVKQADAMARIVKALADANKEQEVLISLYDELEGKDQLVQFSHVKDVIRMCRKAGIKTVKLQAPAQRPESDK